MACAHSDCLPTPASIVGSRATGVTTPSRTDPTARAIVSVLGVMDGFFSSPVICSVPGKDPTAKCREIRHQRVIDRVVAEIEAPLANRAGIPRLDQEGARIQYALAQRHVRDHAFQVRLARQAKDRQQRLAKFQSSRSGSTAEISPP